MKEEEQGGGGDEGEGGGGTGEGKLGGGGVEKRGSLACGQGPFLDSPSQDFLNLSLPPFSLLSFAQNGIRPPRIYSILYCTYRADQLGEGQVTQQHLWLGVKCRQSPLPLPLPPLPSGPVCQNILTVYHHNAVVSSIQLFTNALKGVGNEVNIFY